MHKQVAASPVCDEGALNQNCTTNLNEIIEYKMWKLGNTNSVIEIILILM